jgi:hypothetical protein
MTEIPNKCSGESVLTGRTEVFRSWLESLNAIFGKAPTTKPSEYRREIEVDLPLLNRLLAHIEDRRDYLGRAEPYWSMLTIREFRRDSIASSKDAFYATGAADVALFREAAERCGVSLPWYGTCFELGCGVGRITPWLSDVFDHVIGAGTKRGLVRGQEQHHLRNLCCRRHPA